MDRLRIGPLRREDRERLVVDALENDRGIEQQALFLLRETLRRRHVARLKRRASQPKAAEAAEPTASA
jgi:hypothetical protein